FSDEAAVLSCGVWQSAHCTTLVNRLRPLAMEDGPPGDDVEAAGWSRKRMKAAKATMSLGVATEEAPKLVESSGVPLKMQEGGRVSPGLARSLVKSSLVTPCS